MLGVFYSAPRWLNTDTREVLVVDVVSAVVSRVLPIVCYSTKVPRCLFEQSLIIILAEVNCYFVI